MCYHLSTNEVVIFAGNAVIIGDGQSPGILGAHRINHVASGCMLQLHCGVNVSSCASMGHKIKHSGGVVLIAHRRTHNYQLLSTRRRGAKIREYENEQKCLVTYEQFFGDEKLGVTSSLHAAERSSLMELG